MLVPSSVFGAQSPITAVASVSCAHLCCTYTDTLRNYMLQLRQEVGQRLAEKVYTDSGPSKVSIYKYVRVSLVYVKDGSQTVWTAETTMILDSYLCMYVMYVCICIIILAYIV